MDQGPIFMVSLICYFASVKVLPQSMLTGHEGLYIAIWGLN